MRQGVAFRTLLRKEVTRWLRIWKQTLLPSVVTSVLYFLIFGSFIGERIGEVQGTPYIGFIVPGLIMLAIVTNSYANVSGSFFGSKFQKSIEELLVSPARISTVIAGYAIGGMLRGLAVGVLVALASLLFVPLAVSNIAVILLFALLTSLLFSLFGLVNGIFARSFDDVSIIPTFVLTPLIYLGGVFYSITALPPFWQAVSKANPLFYLIDGFRYGFLGTSDVPVAVALAILLACTLALYVLVHALLARGVRIKE